MNRELDCLKIMFKKAVEWGKLRDDPAKTIKKYRVDNRKFIYLHKEECQRLLDACTGLFRKIIETFILTGMRRGELFGLQWPDIDFRAELITLNETKNGKTRHIPMSARLVQLLKSIPRHISSDYVFCRPNGKPLRDIRKSLETAIKKAEKDKHVAFHTLRHTFASHLIMAGVDLYTVSELLGHSSIEMTQRYAHLSPDHKKRAMSRLAEYLDQCEMMSEVGN